MLRTKSLILAVAAVGILGGGALVAVGMTGNSGAGGEGGGKALSGVFGGTSAPTASPTPTGPSPQELRKIEYAKRTKSLDAALKKYSAAAPEFSVAVLNKKTGETYAYRGSETYETASIVKVQVLACLLLKAQDGQRDLTASEKERAGRMIRASDNDATTSLFTQLGGASAVNRSNKKLGLKQTRVNQSWGLTKTTVSDQVKLLGQLVNTKGPLNEKSRGIAKELMSSVNADQDWGVPAAATKGDNFLVKNGWLARSTEGNRWIINTVGRVSTDDGKTDVSIAVLSHNNADMPGGIAVVEKVAKMTRQYLKY
ncbi:serine hydrolase [Actinoplanes sp. NPDC049265]|uniref:serine hydrolase n=1 Tax=Actinoplanes sp. NPDC049265 TaxID=3363902 RepID=UPI00371C642A